MTFTLSEKSMPDGRHSVNKAKQRTEKEKVLVLIMNFLCVRIH